MVPIKLQISSNFLDILRKGHDKIFFSLKFVYNANEEINSLFFIKSNLKPLRFWFSKLSKHSRLKIHSKYKAYKSSPLF